MRAGKTAKVIDLNKLRETVERLDAKRMNMLLDQFITSDPDNQQTWEVYVLRTGIQWKALPKEYGAASSVHQYFSEWAEAGFFLKMWQEGLMKS
jgi:hypothetical protein